MNTKATQTLGASRTDSAIRITTNASPATRSVTSIEGPIAAALEAYAWDSRGSAGGGVR